MQEHNFDELERRASSTGETDTVRRLEAEALVHTHLEKMKEEGLALVLTEDEEAMLLSYRRRLLRCRKNGEIFTWQMRLPAGVQIVEETAEVVHPREAA